MKAHFPIHCTICQELELQVSRAFSDRSKMLLGVFVGLAKQITARVCISECTNAEAVGRVELLLQEFTADVLDLGKLEQTSSWQQRLYVAFLDHNRRRVAEIHEQLHRSFVDITYCYLHIQRDPAMQH